MSADPDPVLRATGVGWECRTRHPPGPGPSVPVWEGRPVVSLRQDWCPTKVRLWSATMDGVGSGRGRRKTETLKTRFLLSQMSLQKVSYFDGKGTRTEKPVSTVLGFPHGGTPGERRGVASGGVLGDTGGPESTSRLRCQGVLGEVGSRRFGSPQGHHRPQGRVLDPTQERSSESTLSGKFVLVK